MKNRSMARHKLAVYRNRLKLLRKFTAARSRERDDPEKIERLKRRCRNAARQARMCFLEFSRHYDAIPFSPDSESQLLAEKLSELKPSLRNVYVMRTGFGKGISFSDRHIAAALGTKTTSVQAMFLEATALLDAYFGCYVPIYSNEVIAEITKLIPELVLHLQRNEHLLEAVSWQVYEELVGEFFASWGYEVSLVGRNARTSADIIALRAPDPSGVTIRLFIEVKKTARRIGVEAISAVLGSIYSESITQRFHAGVIVSSAGFQDLRKTSVSQLLHLGVELRDGNDVRKWLREYSPSKSGLWLRPQ